MQHPINQSRPLPWCLSITRCPAWMVGKRPPDPASANPSHLATHHAFTAHGCDAWAAWRDAERGWLMVFCKLVTASLVLEAVHATAGGQVCPCTCKAKPKAQRLRGMRAGGGRQPINQRIAAELLASEGPASPWPPTVKGAGRAGWQVPLMWC